MSVFELPTVTLIPNGIHHPPIEDGRLLPNSVKEENNKPNLDDLLVAGKTYSIWDGSYVAVYQYKLKRSFIFRLQDGSLTRFTRLSAGDVKEVA